MAAAPDQPAHAQSVETELLSIRSDLAANRSEQERLVQELKQLRVAAEGMRKRRYELERESQRLRNLAKGETERSEKVGTQHANAATDEPTEVGRGDGVTGDPCVPSHRKGDNRLDPTPMTSTRVATVQQQGMSLAKGQGLLRPKLQPQHYERPDRTPAPAPTDTIAVGLWAAWRVAPYPKPCAKELREALAMIRAINRDFRRGSLSTAIDACGGHGILAMLMLIYGKCERAVVVDISMPRSHAALREIWADFFPKDAVLEYVEGDISTCLATEIARARGIHSDSHPPPPAVEGQDRAADGLADTESDADGSHEAGGRVGVLAIHACDFLSDVIIRECMREGVDFAVMPCCSKDRHQGQMKAAAKSLNVPTEAVIDVARMTTIMANGYTCHWKTVDRSISQHNRILVGINPDPATVGRTAPGQVAQAQLFTDKEMTDLKNRYFDFHGKARVGS